MDRARKLRFAAAIVLTLAVGHGVAVAQGTTPAPPAPDPNAGLQRQVTLSPQEQLAQADADLARMEQARSNVRRQLMEAREQRDVVKTLCLNDKLTQLNVAISSAQERRDSLAAAVKRGDGDLATHDFTILSVLRQRSDQLTTEANQCVGEEVGVVGVSDVKITIDKDLPAEDPSEYPNFSIVAEPPGCASCTK
ncbi:MAG: hypothetical protein IPM79_15220 [Polyangiaceae bacterium]|jgi:hypothetical protein|nr:hypothetical protein [Polyangiaceae bacterium]MBK8938933.1 hypothetical protein [Polyangiaceae bacterium]